MKKLIFLGSFLVASLSFANTNEVKPENYELKNIEVSTEVVTMTCTVTLTVRDQSGQIVAQWNEYYTVNDWDFAACDRIGRARAKQLQDYLNSN